MPQRTWTVSQLRPKTTKADLEERLFSVTAELADLERPNSKAHPRTLRVARTTRDRLQAQIAQIDERDKEKARQDAEDGLDPIKLANRIPRRYGGSV